MGSHEHPSPKRQRLRTVSPERIAKVALALKAGGVELRPDGSVIILTASGGVALSGPEGRRKNPLDRVLG